jgi:hypothetical protein
MSKKNVNKGNSNKVTTPSEFQTKVRNVNSAMKLSAKSLGGVRAIILGLSDSDKENIKLSANFAKILRESKKDKDIYEALKSHVTPHKLKKGGVSYSVWCVLCGLMKYERTQKKAVADAKKEAAK